MESTRRTKVRVAVATTAVAALVAAPVTTAVAASHHAAAGSAAGLQVRISKSNFVVRGAHTLAAGRLPVSVQAIGGDRTAGLARIHKGYSFQQVRQDLTTFGTSFGQNGPSKKGLRALNRVVDNVTFYGGIFAAKGTTTHGTFLLDRPGVYTIVDDSGQLPKHPVELTVTAPSGPQVLPSTAATVTAKTNRRFGGATVLPAHGDVTFVNRSAESPHMLVLNHVKEGTTRKQVIDFLNSNAHTRPPFALNGGAGTDILSNGQKQTLHLHMPAGQYVEMCFMPDPKTGMPHALMGMVRMVHAK